MEKNSKYNELQQIQDQIFHLSQFNMRGTITDIDAVMEELKKKNMN